jgi:hypothetical protein
MTKSKLGGFSCPRCGFTFGRSNLDTVDEHCPRCGVSVLRRKAPLPLLRIAVAAVLLMTAAGVILVASLVFIHDGVATEFQQIPQPRPNRFYVALDVSGTIRPQALVDIRQELLHRLRQFVGEHTVSYEVFIFGLPGCGTKGIRRVVATTSPKTLDDFSTAVEAPINRIRITRRPAAEAAGPPLTTPFYRMLEKLLSDHPGDRIIVISDLVNDEYHCPSPTRFPLTAVTDFGRHREGEIMFLYAAPYTVGKFDTPEIREAFAKEQQRFIARMETLHREGKVRAWFHRMPEDREARRRFLKSRLQSGVPATPFEMVWARVHQLVSVIVLGLRG